MKSPWVCVLNSLTGKHHRTGGWFDLHPGAIDVQEAADHGVKMFNTKSKGKKMFKLISVIGVKTQVSSTV